MVKRKIAKLSNNFTATILSSIGDGVILTNLSGKIVYMNSAAERITGWKVNIAYGKDFDIVFPVSEFDEKQLSKGIISRVIGADTAISLDNNSIIRTKSGELKYISASCSQIRDSDGAISGVVIIFRDDTEKKMQEISVLKSRDYCNNILDQITTLVWKSDSASNCNYVNKTWQDFTGISYDKAMGLGWTNAIHPEDKDRCLQKSAESKSKNEQYQFEIRYLRYDGEYRWCLATGTPYYDLDGKYNGYIGTVHDITELKKAEENLKRYELLSNNTRDIILFVDMDGRIIEANKAAVKAYGYSYEELCSMDIHKIRRNWSYTLEQMKQAEHEGISFESIHYRKDGSWFPVGVNSQGTTIGEKRILLSIIRDISERKKIENELRKAKDAAEAANRAKSEFLANMSHEIRTPINGVIGMVDLTLLTNLDSDQKDNLLTAKSCANSLLEIINDILDFSKMEAGKLTIEDTNFNVKELIEEVIKAHSPHATDKGLELNYTFSSSIPLFLVGDPNRLRQVLNNLISNAIKFTKIGKVDVSVTKAVDTGDEVELKFTVSDTGIGITSENIELLFRSFSQVERSYTKKFSGTGLGLAISKQLVEMMKGKIWVESEVGMGSNFYFLLKFKIGDDKVNNTVQPLQTSKASKPAHVLLVEDNINNQKVITKMLEVNGHRVDTASNGKEAIVLFEQGKFDVILMDIQMPEMGGIEATRRIREKENTDKHTPIIALTAYALRGDKEKFLAMGMDGYISKPIEINELHQTIERAILNKKEQLKKGLDGVLISEEGEVIFSSERIVRSNEQLMPVLSKIEEHIKEMENAAKYADIISIENIAHNLKAISNRIDAREIKIAAFKIELASRRNSLTEAIVQIDNIKRDFKEYKDLILNKGGR